MNLADANQHDLAADRPTMRVGFGTVTWVSDLSMRGGEWNGSSVRVRNARHRVTAASRLLQRQGFLDVEHQQQFVFHGVHALQESRVDAVEVRGQFVDGIERGVHDVGNAIDGQPDALALEADDDVVRTACDSLGGFTPRIVRRSTTVTTLPRRLSTPSTKGGHVWQRRDVHLAVDFFHLADVRTDQQVADIERCQFQCFSRSTATWVFPERSCLVPQ